MSTKMGCVCSWFIAASSLRAACTLSSVEVCICIPCIYRQFPIVGRFAGFYCQRCMLHLGNHPPMTSNRNPLFGHRSKLNWIKMKSLEVRQRTNGSLTASKIDGAATFSTVVNRCASIAYVFHFPNLNATVDLRAIRIIDDSRCIIKVFCAHTLVARLRNGLKFLSHVINFVVIVARWQFGNFAFVCGKDQDQSIYNLRKRHRTKVIPQIDLERQTLVTLS